MPQLLIALDALLDVPRLISAAFVRARSGQVDEASVLSLLVQKQCDERRVGQTIAKTSGVREEDLMREFYRHLSMGARKRVYENAYTILGSLHTFDQAIYYGFPQKTLEQVLRAANFDVKAHGANGDESTAEVGARLLARYPSATVLVGGITGAEVVETKRFHTSRYDLPVLLDELERETG